MVSRELSAAYPGIDATLSANRGFLEQIKAFSNGWAAKGVNVNAIAPGYIATDVSGLLVIAIPAERRPQMNEALIADPVRSRQILERIPAARWGTPDDFEGAILFWASKASDYVNVSQAQSECSL